MCGIAGIISLNKSLVNKPSLLAMAQRLSHRGPDGEAVWINTSNTVGFAHRRLSIIDLSTNAAQPMHYLDRYTIVYNGEIYNYKELRHDLQKAGYSFQSQSDTEVILAAFDFYKNDCVKYFDGMFAFAIWDEKLQQVFCARDVFGEKPFYYFMNKEVFVFASEMKALWAIGVEKNVNQKMMINYLAIGQVQNAANKSHTFYDNIFSLSAAHTGILSIVNNHFTLQQYRNIDKQVTEQITERAAVNKLEFLLENSVNKRLRSDVPIGSSLSGGIDSSTIAYFIQQHNNKKAVKNFKTFSAVFPGFNKDETFFIEEVCNRLSIHNTITTPSAKGLLNDFDKLCYHQEEPFSSSSIYAQYKVYELAAANNVKVVLDGQGADETLAGYTKYIHWYLQELTSRGKFKSLKNERVQLAKNNIGVNFNLKNKIAAFLPAHTSMALEKRAFNLIVDSEFINADLLQSIKGKEWQGIHKPIVTKLNDLLFFTTMQHGLNELLRYADRNSMAHGVEVRLPFLNFELVKFIFSLPSSFKIKDGFTKYILRKTMQDKIPDSILWNAEKIGFETPQKNWMCNEQVQERIIASKEKLVAQKILTPAVLTQKINPKNAHEADNQDWRYLNLSAFI